MDKRIQQKLVKMHELLYRLYKVTLKQGRKGLEEHEIEGLIYDFVRHYDTRKEYGQKLKDYGVFFIAEQSQNHVVFGVNEKVDFNVSLIERRIETMEKRLEAEKQ